MTQLSVYSGQVLRGCVRPPGDKSISHRAMLLGALAEGTSHITGALISGDCLATLGCLRMLGVEIETPVSAPAPYEGKEGRMTTVIVHGHGLHGLRAPAAPLDCMRSGTTMRLLAGILAGQPFESVLTGDPQLLRRPMRRVVEPLRRMGADIEDDEGHGPLLIRGRRLRGYDHTLTVASAQVKSALLLAGLYADGPTTVREPGPSRDHTERMLKAQAGKHASLQVPEHQSPIAHHDGAWTINPALIGRLNPLDIVVPGDMSSAAFLLAAAVLVPGSEVTVEGVGVNPTRTGLLDVLQTMGAEIAIENEREECGEPVADVTARASALHGVEIRGSTVVRMIDEFPVLAIVATQAESRTVVRDAAELRVKESDRIATVVEELGKMGARIEPLPDGFIVEGPTLLKGAAVSSHGDHRLAMALAVAGLVAEGETVIDDIACAADSFPGFVEVMRGIGAAYD